MDSLGVVKVKPKTWPMCPVILDKKQDKMLLGKP